MKKRICTLILLSLTLMSCATHVRELNSLREGTSKEQVVRVLGEPEKKGEYKSSEVWVYSLKDKTFNIMTGFFGGGEEHWVIFDNEKIKEYGEKSVKWPNATLTE